MMSEEPRRAADDVFDPADDVFDPAGVEWTPVSPALARLRRLLMVVDVALTAVVLAVIAYFTGWAWLWIVVVVSVAWTPFGWAAIGRQVQALGYAERADDLLIKRGVMFRELVVVPYGRMQFVDVQAGPVERWFGLAQVQLHTASAGSDARIPGLSAVEAARLRDRLASRGQARLAGL